MSFGRFCLHSTDSFGNGRAVKVGDSQGIWLMAVWSAAGKAISPCDDEISPYDEIFVMRMISLQIWRLNSPADRHWLPPRLRQRFPWRSGSPSRWRFKVLITESAVHVYYLWPDAGALALIAIWMVRCDFCLIAICHRDKGSSISNSIGGRCISWFDLIWFNLMWFFYLFLIWVARIRKLDTGTHTRATAHTLRWNARFLRGTDSMTLVPDAALPVAPGALLAVVVAVGGDATSLVPWNRELIASLRHQDWQRIEFGECGNRKSSQPLRLRRSGCLAVRLSGFSGRWRAESLGSCSWLTDLALWTLFAGYRSVLVSGRASRHPLLAKVVAQLTAFFRLRTFAGVPVLGVWHSVSFGRRSSVSFSPSPSQHPPPFQPWSSHAAPFAASPCVLVCESKRQRPRSPTCICICVSGERERNKK